MSPLVVGTKIAAPRARPEVIVRERLVATLDDLSDRPLIVLCAAAGYGKTTAVLTWLDAADAVAAWVSLDAGDNDPRRLCAHLLASIERVLPDTLGAARDALFGGSSLLDTVLPLAFDGLARAAADRVVVVLDDYHLIDGADCHAFVRRLIDGLPPHVCVVISSRTAPPLRLARREALGTLGELGTDELRFDAAECERLLNGSLGLGLPPDAVAEIDARLEGWPAGLALLASSLAERPDALDAIARINPARISRFLIEEVLDAAEPRLRDFLRRTSILARMNGALCEAVLDDPGARELLAEVRRSNLFVTVVEGGDDGEWVRYHHLFAELLQRELYEREPALAATLHLRASQWFEAAEELEDAIHHASAAGDGARGAALLHERWWVLFAAGRFVTIRRLIEQLPAERGDLNGFCDVLDAFAIMLQQPDSPALAPAISALEARRDERSVDWLLDHMLASPYDGDIGRALRDGWAAIERQPDFTQLQTIAPMVTFVLWLGGERERALDLATRLLELAVVPGGRCFGFAVLSLLASEDGDHGRALRCGEDAVAEARRGGGESAPPFYITHLALAEALRVSGRLDAADERLAHAERITGAFPGYYHQAITLLFRAQLELSRGDRQRARARAATARGILRRYPDIGATLRVRLDAIDAALGERDRGLPGSAPSEAELRVLALLPGERTREEIAAELYLSVATVKSHLHRLYRRLGVTTREEAVATAHHLGLLKAPANAQNHRNQESPDS